VQADNGPTIYTIGILGEDREAKRAHRALERLATETGGVAYFPKDLSQVDEISRAVAHDIRNQYTLGYKPSRPQSQGGFRNVKVEAHDGRAKLQVRTRSGYFAGQRRAADADRPEAVQAMKH
jgi:VWFA-related protein